MVLYRADMRAPDVIRAKGFQAHVPMSLPTARALLLSYCQKPRTPLDLSRLIISSPQPQFISTDPDEECGGYSHRGYIYRIEIGYLSRRTWSDAVLGKQLNMRPNMLWPSLLMDMGNLGLATTIALKHFGSTKEVTFLTSIPGSNIRAYKKSGDTKFISV